MTMQRFGIALLACVSFAAHADYPALLFGADASFSMHQQMEPGTPGYRKGANRLDVVKSVIRNHINLQPPERPIGLMAIGVGHGCDSAACRGAAARHR